MGEKFKIWICPLVLMGTFILFSNGCKKNYPSFVDNEPFKKTALIPLTDQIPYQTLGSGKIVFERINDPGGSGFYVIDIGNKKSYGFRLNSLIRWPYISPDGTKIACCLLNSSDWKSSWNVHIMNLDGSNCYPVFQSNYENHRYPTWTIDGLKVTYYLISSNEGPLYIQTANASSTDRFELTKFYYGDDPTWLIEPTGGFSVSPKGNLVGSSNGPPKTSGILEIEPFTGKTGVKTLISRTNDQILESPTFSPDGSKIAFTLMETDSNGNQSVSINIVFPGGTTFTQLAKVKTFNAKINWGGYSRLTSLCWSPDGTKILFTALTDPNSGFHLYVINSDGSGLTQVTNNLNAYDYDISWGR